MFFCVVERFRGILGSETSTTMAAGTEPEMFFVAKSFVGLVKDGLSKRLMGGLVGRLP